MITVESILRFISSSVEYVRAKMPPNYLTDYSVKFSRYEKGYGWTPSNKKFVLAFAEQNILTSTNVPHFVHETTQALTADARFQNCLTNRMQMQNEFLKSMLRPERVVISLLLEYLRGIDTFVFDPVIADEVAKNFINSLEKAESGVVYFCLLRGFQCDFISELVSRKIKVRKLTDDEIGRLIELDEKVVEDVQNEYVLEHLSRLPFEKQPVEFEEVVVEIDSVITALRLLKPGRVERGNIYSRVDLTGEFIVPLSKLGRWNRRPSFEKSYKLEQADIGRWKKIYEALNSGSIPKRIRIAVDRVDFAAERDRAEDKLLDLLIAMEAIFGDTQGAIGYKIGLRSAFFLSNDFDERQSIRELIDIAWKERGALVHGDMKEKSKLRIQEIVERIESLVRKSLHMIIDRTLAGEKTPDGKLFDELIVGNSPKPLDDRSKSN